MTGMTRYDFTTTRDEIYEPFEENQLPANIRILLCDDDGLWADDTAANDVGLDAWLDSRYGES